MFCPNCGKDCGDAKFCSECGTSLKTTVSVPAALPNKTEFSNDMIQYYELYKGSRLNAVKALRCDTGLGIIDAKKKIDSLFNYMESKEPAKSRVNPVQLLQAKKRKLDETDKLYCPKCLSTNVCANPKGYDYVRGALGVSLGFGWIIGGIGSSKIICTCLKCGHQWKAGKK